MKRRKGELGSALIMFLGVMATVAILAVTLVTLIGNVQWATSKDRARAKVFNVAEAGIDLGQQKLDVSWPIPSPAPRPAEPLGTSDFLALTDTSGMRFLDSDEYPGLIGRVEFFDNPWLDGTYHAPYSAESPPRFDSNDDGMMYIRSVASVGGKTTGVQALVSRVYLPASLLPGAVLYTEGPLVVNGWGSDDVLQAPEGMAATAYYDLDNPDTRINNPTHSIDDVDTNIDDSANTSLEAVFPSLDSFIEKAALAGREFEDEADFISHGGWAAANSTEPRLVVIDEGDLRITEELDTYWASGAGGLVIVRDGNVTMNGNMTLYGLIYCSGTFVQSGTPHVYGAVYAIAGATISGDRGVTWDPATLASLDEMVVASVSVVPGTWRELRGQTPPLPPSP